MFERLNILRFKTAEGALADGRVDEAYAILTAPDMSDHRKAKDLLKTVGERLLARGQDHLMGRRFAEAMADFDRAARCGNSPEKVAEWRNRAAAAARDDADQHAARVEAIRQAEGRMAAGSLAGAQAALEVVPTGDARRAQLEDAIARQSDRAQTAVDEAGAALAAEQFATAVTRFQAARQLNPKAAGLAELEARLVGRLVGDANEALRAGRLGRAEQQLAILGPVGLNRPERTEADEAVRLAREAGRAIAESRYADAGVLLGRMTGLGIRAEWIEQTREQLDKLDELRRSVLEGPLAVFATRDAARKSGDPGLDATQPAPVIPRAAMPPPVRAVNPAMAVGAEAMPARRMILRIDGVGSFLLLTGSRVSIGRAGPGATADVQLISDLSERQAEVIRAGDDYFVAASGGVELAGRPVEHALLQDGDRIRLGHRVRLKFARPSRKSAAAVLELGEGVRMVSDARRAILLGGPLLIGARRECHIPAPGLTSDYVVVLRDGGLSIKPWGGGLATALTPGQPIELGELRIGVQNAEMNAVGRVVG